MALAPVATGEAATGTRAGAAARGVATAGAGEGADIGDGEIKPGTGFNRSTKTVHGLPELSLIHI